MTFNTIKKPFEFCSHELRFFTKGQKAHLNLNPIDEYHWLYDKMLKPNMKARKKIRLKN